MLQESEGFYASLPVWLQQFLPIVLLLVVITFVIARLPRIQVGHTDAFRFRRVRNWLPVGLLYAFLYVADFQLSQTSEIGLFLVSSRNQYCAIREHHRSRWCRGVIRRAVAVS